MKSVVTVHTISNGREHEIRVNGRVNRVITGSRADAVKEAVRLLRGIEFDRNWKQ